MSFPPADGLNIVLCVLLIRKSVITPADDLSLIIRVYSVYQLYHVLARLLMP